MGHCAKATFSYGFVLKEEELENFLDALGCEDSSDLIEINSWLRSKVLTPFYFSAQRRYMEEEDEDDDDDDDALVISFVGRVDREEFETHELEVWGRDTGATKFKTIPMPADKEFMVSAKEAFQKLKDSEVFKEAEITEIVPQWILMLSVG